METCGILMIIMIIIIIMCLACVILKKMTKRSYGKMKGGNEEREIIEQALRELSNRREYNYDAEQRINNYIENGYFTSFPGWMNKNVKNVYNWLAFYAYENRRSEFEELTKSKYFDIFMNFGGYDNSNRYNSLEKGFIGLMVKRHDNKLLISLLEQRKNEDGFHANLVEALGRDEAHGGKSLWWDAVVNFDNCEIVVPMYKQFDLLPKEYSVCSELYKELNNRINIYEDILPNIKRAATRGSLQNAML